MPTHQPQFSARGRGRLARLALVLACALAGTAHAQDAPADAGAPSSPAHAPHAWWTAFHEPTLDLLLADAGSGPQADAAQRLARQVRATSLYLEARVYSVRMMTASVMHRSAEREATLLQRQGQAQGDLARAVALVARDAAAREQHFELLRSGAIAALAQTLGSRYSAEALALLLEPALAERHLPVAEFGLPDAVSGLVLRQRPDVMAAEADLTLSRGGGGVEQLHLAEYLQALSQEIRPEDAAAAPLAPAQQAGDMADVLQHARQEVAGRLAQFTALGESVNEQGRYVRQLQAGYEQALKDFGSGAIQEAELLSRLQQLLLEEDRLAAALGSAGLAWVAFEQSIGGAGQASTSDLLGAGTDDE